MCNTVTRSFTAEAMRISVKERSDDPAGKRRRRRGQGKELVASLAFLIIVGFACVKLMHALERVEEHDHREESLHREVLHAGRWQTFPGEASSHPDRLLLATHTRLLWFNYHTRDVTVLHEGEGIYYGHFPGDEVDARGSPTTLWVVSRPHNWHPKDSTEWLLKLDINTGKELSRVQIKSRFTHDAIRVGSRVYIASTGTGEVLELSYPSMRLAQRHRLFTEREHVNTLSPSVTSPGHLWAMLHGKGSASRIANVRFHSGKGEVAKVASDVGGMSHGLVHWRGVLLVLDSQGAALMAVDPETEERHILWRANAEPKLPFLKGLAVVDDIAYIGVSQQRERSQRNDPSLDSKVVAVHLLHREVMWALELPTHGLLNAIGAPHLAVGSGYHANFLRVNDDGRTAGQIFEEFQAERTMEGSRGAVAAEAVGVPTGALGDSTFQANELKAVRGADMPWSRMPEAVEFVGGKWASGWPFIALAKKRTGLKGAAGFLPLFHTDVAAFKDEVLGEPDSIWTAEQQKRENAYLEGRASNMEMVKPGVESIHLIFSDGDLMGTVTAYRFPYYQRYAQYLDPILEDVLGSDRTNVIRLQLARMKPGTVINHHQDDGAWVKRGHRIHVPLSVSPGAEFHICGREQGDSNGQCSQLIYGEGDVFELNNRRLHYLKNGSGVPRIHLVIDVLEAPVRLQHLHPGQVCHYKSKQIVC